MKPVTLLLAQSAPKLLDKQRNIRTISEQADKARRRNIDLLIFPELHLTGYTMRDEVYNLAEPVPGPSTRKIEKIAREHSVHIVYGMPEEGKAKGVVHNTSVLIGPKGIIGKYRKVYLPTHTGLEEGLQFWGGSRVVAPNGSILVQCKYDDEAFEPCKIDLDEVRRSRPFIPTIKDVDPVLFDMLQAKSREA